MPGRVSRPFSVSTSHDSLTSHSRADALVVGPGVHAEPGEAPPFGGAADVEQIHLGHAGRERPVSTRRTRWLYAAGVKLIRLAGAALLLISAVACTRESPPDECRATVPPSAITTTSESAPAIVASWCDTFDRPDTQLGLGDGWDMRAGYVDRFPMPAATDGFLRGGAFTYAGDSTVYGARQFRGTVREMGTTGRWRQIRDGKADTTIAMAITPNDRLVTEMVHFAANRSVWELTVRRGGPFEPVAKGSFNPPLSLDREYTFAIAVTDDAVTVTIPDGEPTTHPVDTAGLLGDRAFWEEYIKPPPASTTFDFDTVWAVEDGQPLSPIGR